jgi:hypothetical protein
MCKSAEVSISRCFWKMELWGWAFRALRRGWSAGIEKLGYTNTMFTRGKPLSIPRPNLVVVITCATLIELESGMHE